MAPRLGRARPDGVAGNRRGAGRARAPGAMGRDPPRRLRSAGGRRGHAGWPREPSRSCRVSGLLELETRSDLAPRSSGEEDRNVKPLIGTLRVTNPVRQSRASSRKRVLRGGGRPPLRSVDSEIKRCVIEPRNFLVVSLRRGQTRGPSQALAALGPTSVPGHTGVGGTWRMIKRVPRELGRPCRLHRHCRSETRLTNSRLIRGPRPRPTGTNEGRNDGIAQRRKRSAARRAARSRSVS
jgi:hypothetical protein